MSSLEQTSSENLAQRMVAANERLNNGPLAAFVDGVIAKVTGGSYKIRSLGILSQPPSPATTKGLETNAHISSLIGAVPGANDSHFEEKKTA